MLFSNIFCPSGVLEKIPGQHVEHMVNMFLKEFCGLHFAKHLNHIDVAAKGLGHH